MIEQKNKPQDYYDIHIFCCTNKRAPEKQINSCGNEGAEDVLVEFKSLCKQANLGNIRINKAGCLGRCSSAKVLVIYPDSIWYRYDNLNDLNEIINLYLKNGQIVDRLILKNEKVN